MKMVERAAKAAKAEWSGFIDCPGEMYDSEAYRITKAALLAALDEDDEDLVSRVGMEIADEVSGNYSEMTAKRIIAALKAAAQGEQKP